MAFTHQKFHCFLPLPYYSYSKPPQQFKLQTLEISTSSPTTSLCSPTGTRDWWKAYKQAQQPPGWGSPTIPMILSSLKAWTCSLFCLSMSNILLMVSAIQIMILACTHSLHEIMMRLVPTLWSLKPSFNKICCISVSPGNWNDYCEALILKSSVKNKRTNTTGAPIWAKAT